MVAVQPGTTDFTVSYLTLRKAIGWIGIGMPLVVKTGASLSESIPLNASISAYYYTSMRDVLVGALFAIGVFLYFYRGRDRGENVLMSIAGLAAIGIGLLPMDPYYHPAILKAFPELADPRCYFNYGPRGYHLYAVLAFFATVSYISLFQFTKTDQPVMTAQKRKRNKVYVASGLTMIGAFLVILYLKYRWPDASIFWPETVAIVAFSVSWLTKGQQILKD
jgi:hypothetical protein